MCLKRSPLPGSYRRRSNLAPALFDRLPRPVLRRLSTLKSFASAAPRKLALLYYSEAEVWLASSAEPWGMVQTEVRSGAGSDLRQTFASSQVNLGASEGSIA